MHIQTGFLNLSPSWTEGVRRPAAGAIFALVVSAFISVPSAFGGDDQVYAVEPITVTAGRTLSAGERANRSITVIEGGAIEEAPVRDPAGILEYVPGVDSRRRGPLGVQSDISIRGASFEETLVLIDGMKVGDPQTGHHNFDLPVTLFDLERIEVLKGEGSSIFGPGAFGGAVNFVTRRPEGKSAHLNLSAGEFGLLEAGASLSLPAGITTSRLSALRRESSGYRRNTDFDISTVSLSSAVAGDVVDARFLLGWTDKKFGANDFYTDRFPDQWEETETLFLSARGEGGGDFFTITPVLYWRQHRDRFLLDRHNPSFYENRHETDVYGTELHTFFTSLLGSTAIGMEFGREEVDSDSLGDHDRSRGGLYGEHRVSWGSHFSLGAEAFAYHYSDWGWEVWPGLNAGLRFNESTRLFASAGRSFRVPTYTELFYESPANMGNPELEPEEAQSFETGIEWTGGEFSAGAALFRREGENLIDWVRDEPDSPWTAMNVAQVDTRGLEAQFRFVPEGRGKDGFWKKIEIGYTFLDSNRKTGGDRESKYLLEHLKHQFVAVAGHRLFAGARQTWFGRYEERAGSGGYFLLDTRLELRTGRLIWYLDGKNLLDSEYSETGGVPMPGRWIGGGVRLDFP